MREKVGVDPDVGQYSPPQAQTLKTCWNSAAQKVSRRAGLCLLWSSRHYATVWEATGECSEPSACPADDSAASIAEAVLGTGFPGRAHAVCESHWSGRWVPGYQCCPKCAMEGKQGNAPAAAANMAVAVDGRSRAAGWRCAACATKWCTTAGFCAPILREQRALYQDAAYCRKLLMERRRMALKSLRAAALPMDGTEIVASRGRSQALPPVLQPLPAPVAFTEWLTEWPEAAARATARVAARAAVQAAAAAVGAAAAAV